VGGDAWHAVGRVQADRGPVLSTRELHRGSRSDADQGGRYLGIPQSPVLAPIARRAVLSRSRRSSLQSPSAVPHNLGVHETGAGPKISYPRKERNNEHVKGGTRGGGRGSAQTPRVIVQRGIEHLWSCRGDGRWSSLERYLISTAHLDDGRQHRSRELARRPRPAIRHAARERDRADALSWRNPRHTYEKRGGQQAPQRPQVPSRILGPTRVTKVPPDCDPRAEEDNPNDLRRSCDSPPARTHRRRGSVSNSYPHIQSLDFDIDREGTFVRVR
jgi:hypothetical protein